MDLGVVSLDMLQYLYKHALKNDNTEMIAYVLSSANKFYPDKSLYEAEDMNIWIFKNAFTDITRALKM